MIKPLISNKELNDFLRDNREEALCILKRKYSSMSMAALEDVYQESSIALYKNIISEELIELTCPLFSYFVSICVNQTRKWYRNNVRTIKDDVVDKQEDDYLKEKHIIEGRMVNVQRHDDEGFDMDRFSELTSLVGSFKSTDNLVNIEHQSFWSYIIEGAEKMSEPCNKILVGHYWKGLSYKEIAEAHGMKSEDVCKTQASRCRKKFTEFIKLRYPNYEKYIR